MVAASCSWVAGDENQPVLDYLVTQAGRLGIVSFFSAGNSAIDGTEESPVTVGLTSPYVIVVASSNSVNQLSVFSNWNATAVDFAAPDSNVLSTIPSKYAASYFDAQLSHDAGKDLLYWNDSSDYSPDLCQMRSAYFFPDGHIEPIDDPSVAEAVAIEKTEYDNQGALKVSIDPAKLIERGINPNTYALVLEWKVKNPFKGTNYASGDIMATANMAADESELAAGGWAQSDADLFSNPEDGERFRIYGGSSKLFYYADYISAAYVAADAVDTDSDTITMRGMYRSISPRFDANVDASEFEPSDESIVYYVRGFGIGRFYRENASGCIHFPYCSDGARNSS